MADVLGIEVNLGNDPQVATRIALNFRKSALISALDMIDTAVEDLMAELEECDGEAEADSIMGEIESMEADAKEITDELDSTAWDGNDEKEA
jgi:hypothetical protein